MPDYPPLGDFMIEYSKSSRSKCKLTGKNIPQKVLRIGKIVRSDVDSYGGNYPEWYNFEDYILDEDLVEKLKNHKIHGLNKLKANDKERIKALMNQEKKRSLEITFDEDEMLAKKIKMTGETLLTKTSVLEEFTNDLIYEISKFLNAESFANLALLNSRMYGKFNSCLCDMMNRNEFVSIMRTKNVDPRLSVHFTSTLPAVVADYKKNNSLSIGILFMALDRYPGGNSDEMIISWKLKVKPNKPVQVKKGSLHSWDGSLSGNRSMKIQIERSPIDLLKKLMRQSCDTPTKDKLHYYTIRDMRYDSEDYDTEWSCIKIDVSLSDTKESIFSFHQQAIYPNERKKEEILEYPVSENATSLVQSLSTFCGISRVINESENDSISSKEPPKYPKAYCFDINEACDKYEPLDIYLHRIYEK